MRKTLFALLAVLLLLPVTALAAQVVRVYATTPTPVPVAATPTIVPTSVPTVVPEQTAHPVTPSPVPTATPTQSPVPPPTPTLTPSPTPTPAPSPTPAPKVINLITNPEQEWPFSKDEPLLEIWIPKIRDADAALIRCGNSIVAIDCADEPQAGGLVALAQAYANSQIDTLFITHPHHDHIGGLGVLAESVKIKRMIVSFPLNFNDHMLNAMTIAGQHGIGAYTMKDGDVFDIGGAQLTVLCKVSESSGVNDRSAVMNLTYGSCSMLWMADTTTTVQSILMDIVPAALLNVDILKAPHHGLTSFIRNFLKLASPKAAIITNIMRVPGTESTLKDYKISVLYTYQKVTHIATDGIHWAIEQLDPENLPENPIREGKAYLVVDEE